MTVKKYRVFFLTGGVYTPYTLCMSMPLSDVGDRPRNIIICNTNVVTTRLINTCVFGA